MDLFNSSILTLYLLNVFEETGHPIYMIIIMAADVLGLGLLKLRSLISP